MGAWYEVTDEYVLFGSNRHTDWTHPPTVGTNPGHLAHPPTH